MVVQKAIDTLKDKPHEEKKVVASGIAIGVVVILLVIWAFIFLRNIQKGSQLPTLQGSAVPQDQLNAQFVTQAQQQLNQYYQNSQQQLRDIRESGGSGAAAVDPGAGVAPNGNDSGFGAQQSGF